MDPRQRALCRAGGRVHQAAPHTGHDTRGSYPPGRLSWVLSQDLSSSSAEDMLSGMGIRTPDAMESWLCHLLAE